LAKDIGVDIVKRKQITQTYTNTYIRQNNVVTNMYKNYKTM